jgi:hypothetical protein
LRAVAFKRGAGSVFGKTAVSMADGKIVESWSTWDRLSVLGQLGAIPIARV